MEPRAGIGAIEMGCRARRADRRVAADRRGGHRLAVRGRSAARFGPCRLRLSDTRHHCRDPVGRHAGHRLGAGRLGGLGILLLSADLRHSRCQSGAYRRPHPVCHRRCRDRSTRQSRARARQGCAAARGGDEGPLFLLSPPRGGVEPGRHPRRDPRPCERDHRLPRCALCRGPGAFAAADIAAMAPHARRNSARHRRHPRRQEQWTRGAAARSQDGRELAHSHLVAARCARRHRGDRAWPSLAAEHRRHSPPGRCGPCRGDGHAGAHRRGACAGRSQGSLGSRDAARSADRVRLA